MNFWQNSLVLIFACFSFLIFLKGFHESSRKKNSYGITYFLLWMGIFVWGDAVIIGPFWVIASAASYIFQDWILFLLIFSVFWVVRSIGETIFWFGQQFSHITRYAPKHLPGYRFIKDDSLWFMYQITVQCITVFSIIISLYLANVWLKRIG